MKTRANPTEIVLKDLPTEGRDFNYSRKSGELDKSLADLVKTNDYDVKFQLIPVGNAYSLKGELTTAMDLQCSLCASDFAFPVKQKLNELIVVQKPMAKGDFLTRANHAHELQDQGPDYLMLDNESFNVAEYIHEVVALAEPIRPLCAPDKPEGCANANDRIQRDWLSFDKESDKGIRANPFQVLEKMKLKS